MQFSMITVAAALASVASASFNGTASAVWVTDVVTAYTTYCPASTTFSLGGTTYTVTEATTLTLPCPCTVSSLVHPTAAATLTTAPVYANSTVKATSPATVATTVVGTTSTKATSTAPAFTGAANKLSGSVAGAAGILGMAAYLL